jgi:hypothetical protein
MIYVTYNSEYRNLLRVDFKALARFIAFLGVVFVGRFLLFKYVLPIDTASHTKSMADSIPWQVLLGVFWEDAAHSMPLVLAGMMLAKSKIYSWLSKPLMVLVMLSFGSGHLYQGPVMAFLLSFYVMYSMKKGREYGFGTVMIAHILYDLSTLLSIRWMLS